MLKISLNRCPLKTLIGNFLSLWFQVAVMGTPLPEVVLEILKGKWDHERTKFCLPPLMTLVSMLISLIVVPNYACTCKYGHGCKRISYAQFALVIKCFLTH